MTGQIKNPKSQNGPIKIAILEIDNQAPKAEPIPEQALIEQKYIRKLVKKHQKDPSGLYILRRRTLSSALAIIRDIQSIPFETITTTLYHYCADIKSMGIYPFIRAYEAELELASANPDQFVCTLHQFYTKMEREIKKNNLYHDFFDFFYFCNAIIFNSKKEERNSDEIIVINHYIDLIIQQFSYLVPDKFNPNKMLAGQTTDGVLITIDDPFPSCDVPEYTLETMMYRHNANLKIENLIQIYMQYGYSITCLEDIQTILLDSRVFTNNVYYIMPYVNEYTFDILPQKPFQMRRDFHMPITRHGHNLRDLLMRRRKSLPTNGCLVNTYHCGDFHELHLKEICSNNAIVLLYKVVTKCGEFCGSYDTRHQIFMSVFSNSNQKDWEFCLEQFVLWIYAAIVCEYEDIRPNKIADNFTCDKEPISIEVYSRGGNLRNAFKPQNDESRHDAQGRIGSDRYEKISRAINYKIRKLPKGQKSSEQARQRALELGYILNDDETYVQPFIRQVYTLAAKASQKR